MAHPEEYAEFSRLQHRYWVLFIREIGIGIVMGLLLVSINALAPAFQFLHLLTIICGVVFVITWFQGVVTYFRAMNWRCPDCQHRFAGLRVGRALMNSLLIQRCRYCGSRPDYEVPMRDASEEKDTTFADQC